MLRKAYIRYHIFKSFTSSVASQQDLSGASLPDVQTSISKYATKKTNNNGYIIQSNPPLHTLSAELHNSEKKHIRPLINTSKSPSIHLRSTSKIGEYLESGQYLKLLIKLSVDNGLNDVYMSDVFSNADFTKSEYSLFINKLLSEEKLDIKLSKVIPDMPHTELIFRLYESYRDNVVDLNNPTLTPLELYDLNLFVKTFIKQAQLSKAQKVLDFILFKKPLNRLLSDADVNVLIQYLRLRCGAISKYWNINPASRRNLTKITLGRKASDCRLAKSYKFQDDKGLLQIINAVLGESNWKNRRSARLDTAIIYSLGHLGQTDMIEKYVNDTWLCSSNNETLRPYPNSELLVAILTSYCAKEGTMKRGLELFDRFLKDYPDLELDPLFWRRLLQLSSLLWDKKRDRKATLIHGCWTIMKQWHIQRRRRIPYDYGIVKELYPVFVRTFDRKGALEVLTKTFFGAFIRPEFLIRPNELSLLCKYQKFILKMIALKGNYGKGIEFCKEWNFDPENKAELHKYFLKWHKIYKEKTLLKVKRKITSQAKLQQQYDEMEEDDMLLGRLW